MPVINAELWLRCSPITRLIETLLTNAQKDESKRSIRLSNPAIKRRLVDVTGIVFCFSPSSKPRLIRAYVPGAQDYLLSCCWAPKTVAFEPHLVYPAAPNARQSQALDFGFRVLNERLQVLEERFSKAQEAAQLHKLEEDARVGRAMAEFKEDREKNKVRAEREKLARAAQEEQDRLEALRQQEQQQQSDAGSAHPGSINDASWASGMPGHLLVESQSEEAREDKKDV